MKNKLLILIPILLVIVIGITFAWWTWTSTNTDVTFTVEGITVTYQAGENITGIKLIPVSTKEKGVTDNTAISKEITVAASKTLYFDLNMNLEVCMTLYKKLNKYCIKARNFSLFLKNNLLHQLQKQSWIIHTHL